MLSVFSHVTIMACKRRTEVKGSMQPVVKKLLDTTNLTLLYYR